MKSEPVFIGTNRCNGLAEMSDGDLYGTVILQNFAVMLRHGWATGTASGL